MNDDPLAPEVAPVAAAPVTVPVRPDPAMLSREHIEAELQRRGVMQAPGSLPSLRDEERKLKLKQIAGSLARVDIENELARREAETKLKAQPTDLESQANSAGRERAATTALGVASTNPEDRAKALNEERHRSVENAFAQTVGTLPDQFEEPANIQPVPFDQFFEDKFAPQINGQQDPRFPLGSKEDNQLRAQNYNRLFSDSKVKSMYDKYVTDASKATTPIKRGDPKYYAKLEEAVREKVAQDAYTAAKLKAVPGVLEAQAKGAAEAPGKIQESSKKLRDEIQNNKILENAKLQMVASNQIKQLTSKSNPSNQDDLAIIYSTVRALDPVSAVREGEISLLKKGVGLPTQVMTAFNSIFGKENAVLTPEIRKSLSKLAESQAKTARKTAEPELKRYFNAASTQGLPLTDIFSTEEMDVLHPGEASASEPAPTTTVGREEADSAVTVTDPKLAPADKKYIKSPDGRTFLNPNFKG